MDVTFLSILRDSGSDPDGALCRFAGNTDLYKRFLIQFLTDDTIGQIRDAMDREDWEGMLTAAHTLKGVAGNLGLDPLYRASSMIVSALRCGDTGSAQRAYGTLEAAYESICLILEQLREGGLQ